MLSKRDPFEIQRPKLEVKKWKNIFQANSNHKRAEVATLI